MSRALDVGRQRVALLLTLASGFAGLGYQIVWTQQCALWLGHESAAVLAVVAALFGGMAVGAFAFGGRIAESTRPARWYAGCEVVIALWSLFLIAAMPPFSAVALRLTGAQPTAVWQWSVAFLGTLVLFLPATVAMGATLPAMERIISQGRAQTCGRASEQMNDQRRDRALSLAALYASNTFGAVLGVLAAAFWLVPRIGLARTAGVSAAINLLCGLTALILFASVTNTTTTGPVPAARGLSAAGTAGVITRLAVTGFLGIGYEVLVVRVLAQVTENTVYTFAMLLAVYLVGSAAGAAVYRRYLLTRASNPSTGVGNPVVTASANTNASTNANARTDDFLLGALAIACLIGTGSLWTADRLRAWALLEFGGGMGAALAAEALIALAAFAAPTLVMGALFSHLSSRANANGVSFGSALGTNTVGATAAPVLLGVVAVPALGPKVALLLIAVGYLALTSRHAWFKPIVLAPATIALALGLFTPPLAFMQIPEGGHVISHRDGIMSAVTVVEDRDGVARLHINNRQQEGSSATGRVDARQAWLPLLLHPRPEQALFLGLGTGVTAASAAEDPQLHVDAVELLPEVAEAAVYFRRALPAPDAPVHVMIADARRYVRTSARGYDVIVSDNFHPARSGSGSLYSVEHLQAVRGRLNTGGLYCQWLPLHQLDLDSLRSIVQSFLVAYPWGWAMLASNSLQTPVLGLVGRREPTPFDPAGIRARLARPVLLPRMAALALDDELAVLGSVVAGPEALRRFAGTVAPNTDDRPVVTYQAPRLTYAPSSSPRDRLLALLRELTGYGLASPQQAAQLVPAGADPAWLRRLTQYWVARDRFLEVGRHVRPSARVQEMLGQVREPLLSILRISPDFRPAYDPLLSMATDLARTDVAAARALLTTLTEVQPARSEAARARDLLFH